MAFLNALNVPEDWRYGTYEDGVQPLVNCMPYSIKKPECEYKDGLWTVKDGKGDYPMNFVTWYGAKEFARWAGGSLPSEAQWEFACRAGTTTPYFWGTDMGLVGDYAWYRDNSGDQTHEVGLKEPNPWGLYDILGNVAEWCLDGKWAYDDHPDAKENPQEATDYMKTEGSQKTVRGCQFTSSLQHYQSGYEEFRSACRSNGSPGSATVINGFRVVFNE